MQSRPKLRLAATWRGRVPIEARSSAQSESQEYRTGAPNLKGIAFCAPIPAAIVQDICPNHSGGTRSFRCLASLFPSARRKACQMFARSSSRKLLTSAKFTKRGLICQEFCPSHSFSSVVGYADEPPPVTGLFMTLTGIKELSIAALAGIASVTAAPACAEAD